ncbi:hypothetical protein E4Z66_03565 [Aliishimia ponticola]|uniref:Uncharacterized protein n=1 Tax=Aliishimia ponticola TaxID=2499833 RepID=A0A4S4NGD3_9RHOB|nr:toprim domain-containing protein [Aliishimia ponticola]THH38659.1 hypothetical protein E4Z66_03565 [Aliishimia ponticola]
MTDAREITRSLGGRWYRRYGSAPCPICQTERRKQQNALTLSDAPGGRLLAHCKKNHCAFTDILAALGLARGDYRAPDAVEVAQREAERRAEDAKRAAQAQQCWQEAGPITGTVAETYLRGRKISCELPDSLRFHPNAWHRPSAKRHPAMVALVDGARGFAVHRTFLLPDGTGKARIDPAKMMLGNVAGGAVRLTKAHGPLVVAEGVETALSLSCGFLRAPATIWAALSTSGLRGLCLPPEPSRLTIAPDGDPEGRAAAHNLATRASALGWQVSLLPAPDGRDWNDILTMKGRAT